MNHISTGNLILAGCLLVIIGILAGVGLAIVIFVAFHSAVVMGSVAAILVILWAIAPRKRRFDTFLLKVYLGYMTTRGTQQGHESWLGTSACFKPERVPG
jgi:hypothetical protein